MLVSRAMRLKRIVRMVANKPGAPGRLRINVKTVAQGMPVDRHHLWYLPPALSSAGGPWVRPSPGIPCTLRLVRVKEISTARARSAAGAFAHGHEDVERDDSRPQLSASRQQPVRRAAPQ